MTDTDRLHDSAQKLRCDRYLAHHPDAERDVPWLIEQVAEWDARIAVWEALLQRNECAFLLA